MQCTLLVESETLLEAKHKCVVDASNLAAIRTALVSDLALGFGEDELKLELFDTDFAEFIALDKLSLLGESSGRAKVRISRRGSKQKKSPHTSQTKSPFDHFGTGGTTRSDGQSHGIANCVGTWSATEQQLFEHGLAAYGRDWKRIRELVCTRTLTQIRSHAQKYFKSLKRERERQMRLDMKPTFDTHIHSTTTNSKNKSNNNNNSENSSHLPVLLDSLSHAAHLPAQTHCLHQHPIFHPHHSATNAAAALGQETGGTAETTGAGALAGPGAESETGAASRPGAGPAAGQVKLESHSPTFKLDCLRLASERVSGAPVFFPGVASTQIYARTLHPHPPQFGVSAIAPAHTHTQPHAPAQAPPHAPAHEQTPALPSPLSSLGAQADPHQHAHAHTHAHPHPLQLPAYPPHVPGFHSRTDGSIGTAHRTKQAPTVQGRWSTSEQRLFIEGLHRHGRDWKRVADWVTTRTLTQIRTHAQKFFKRLATTGDGVFRYKEEHLALMRKALPDTLHPPVPVPKHHECSNVGQQQQHHRDVLQGGMGAAAGAVARAGVGAQLGARAGVGVGAGGGAAPVGAVAAAGGAGVTSTPASVAEPQRYLCVGADGKTHHLTGQKEKKQRLSATTKAAVVNTAGDGDAGATATTTSAFAAGSSTTSISPALVTASSHVAHDRTSVGVGQWPHVVPVAFTGGGSPPTLGATSSDSRSRKRRKACGGGDDGPKIRANATMEDPGALQACLTTPASPVEPQCDLLKMLSETAEIQNQQLWQPSPKDGVGEIMSRKSKRARLAARAAA